MKASEKSVKQKEIYRKLTKKGKRIKKDEFLCVFSCVREGFKNKKNVKLGLLAEVRGGRGPSGF